MILCFSATGNSKYCAEYIASRTGDDVISLNDMMRRGESSVDCSGSERLGIIALNAAFAVTMPDNYVPLFRVESPERQKEHLAEADITLQDITSDIMAKRPAQKFTGRPPKIFQRMVVKFAVQFQRKVKGFSVNNDCIGCGLCVRVCPMNIITLKDNRPVWTRDNCACCLACLNRCPKRAINRGRSSKNGRYINPNVTM